MFPGKQQTQLPRPVDRKLGLCASPPKATASGNPESAPHSSVCGAFVSPTSIYSLAMPRVGDQFRGSLPGGPRWLSEGSSPVKPASLVSSSAGHRQWMSQGFLRECSELLFVPASWGLRAGTQEVFVGWSAGGSVPQGPPDSGLKGMTCRGVG